MAPAVAVMVTWELPVGVVGVVGAVGVIGGGVMGAAAIGVLELEQPATIPVETRKRTAIRLKRRRWLVLPLERRRTKARIEAKGSRRAEVIAAVWRPPKMRG